MTFDFRRARTQMVETQLAARKIDDPRVLDAFRDVPRESFVDGALATLAYDDAPLPIGDGQTISQPYIVAFMVQALALRGDERVLEVGTGSGYAAAILSRVAGEVFSVECIPALADSARERLHRLGFDVEVACGDGALGWPERAPFDAVAVAAHGARVPPALLSQLAVGGRLVMPIGSDASLQVLTRVTRESGERYREEPLTHVRFVPLVGEER